MCIIWWSHGCPHCRRLIPVRPNNPPQPGARAGSSKPPQTFVDVDTVDPKLPLYRLAHPQPETHEVHSIWRCYEVDTGMLLRESLSKRMEVNMADGLHLCGDHGGPKLGAGGGAGVGARFEAGLGACLGPGSLGVAPENPYLGLNLPSSHLNLNQNHNNLHLNLNLPSTAGPNNPAILVTSNPVLPPAPPPSPVPLLSSIDNSNNVNNNSIDTIPGASHVAPQAQAQGLSVPRAAQFGGLPSGSGSGNDSSLASPGLPLGFPPPVLHPGFPHSNLHVPCAPGSYAFHAHGPLLLSPSPPLFPLPSPNLSGFPMGSLLPNPLFTPLSGSFPGHFYGPPPSPGLGLDTFPGSNPLPGQGPKKGGLESFRHCPYLQHRDASNPEKEHPPESCWLTRSRKGKVGIVDGMLMSRRPMPSGTGVGAGAGQGCASGTGTGNGQGRQGQGGHAGPAAGPNTRAVQGAQAGGYGAMHTGQVSGHAARGQIHAGQVSVQTKRGHHAGVGGHATSTHGHHATHGRSAVPHTVPHGASHGATPNTASLVSNVNPPPNQNQPPSQLQANMRVQWWKMGWSKLLQFYLPVGGRGSRLTMSDIDG